MAIFTRNDKCGKLSVGASNEQISERIASLIDDGYDRDQAVAIAYREAGKSNKDSLGVMRFDRGMFKGKAIRTEEGYIKADAVVSRIGVFTYRNPDGTIRRELRHPDEIYRSESLDSLKLVPVTNDHPSIRLLDSTTAKQFQIGSTGENVRPDGRHIMSTLVITNADAIKDIEAGRRELSCGYTCDLLKEDGVYEGQRYDFRQTNVRYNHVAVVDKARAGAEARLVLDHCDAVEIDELTSKDNNYGSSKIKSNNPFQRSKRMVTLKLDGLDYECAPEVANAYNKAIATVAELTTKLDAATKDIAKITAERDSHKANLDKVEKDFPAKIASAVKARLDLERIAHEHLDEKDVEKLDKLSDTDIRNLIILKAFPTFKADGMSADYIAARFDCAVESLKADGTAYRLDALANQRKQMGADNVGQHSNQDSVDPEEARQRMIQRSREAYKAPTMQGANANGKGDKDCMR